MKIMNYVGLVGAWLMGFVLGLIAMPFLTVAIPFVSGKEAAKDYKRLTTP